jgi:hypothetical protein
VSEALHLVRKPIPCRTARARVLQYAVYATQELRSEALVIFDGVEWDESNLEHACRRVTAEEIEQVIANASTVRRHRRYADRILFTDRTDGGKLLTVVARYDAGHHLVRPITAWEET